MNKQDTKKVVIVTGHRLELSGMGYKYYYQLKKIAPIYCYTTEEDNNLILKSLEDYTLGDYILSKPYNTYDEIEGDSLLGFGGTAIDKPDFREDKDLIKVLEDLGENSYPDWSSLKIVEIPNDVDYYIHEYDDGSESIHEKHRFWL